MATWKKVLLEGQQTNLGDSDLTQTDASRTFDTGTNQDLKITADIGTTQDRVVFSLNNSTSGADSDNRNTYFLGNGSGQPLFTEAFLTAGNRDTLGLHEDTGFYIGEKFIFQVNDTSPHSVRLEYTDSGSGAGPNLKLARQSFTPNNGDRLGHIDFTGWSAYDPNTNVGTEKLFGRIQSRIEKTGAQLDQSTMSFFVRPTGNTDIPADLTEAMRLLSDNYDSSGANADGYSTNAHKRTRFSFHGASPTSLFVNSNYQRYNLTHGVPGTSPTPSLTSAAPNQTATAMLYYQGLQTGADKGVPMLDRSHVHAVNISYSITSPEAQTTTQNGTVRVQVYRNGDQSSSDNLVFDTEAIGVLGDNPITSSGQSKNIATATRYGGFTTTANGGYLARNDFFSVKLSAVSNVANKQFRITDVVCHVMVYHEMVSVE